jgi:hypothetical protein
VSAPAVLYTAPCPSWCARHGGGDATDHVVELAEGVQVRQMLSLDGLRLVAERPGVVLDLDADVAIEDPARLRELAAALTRAADLLDGQIVAVVW